MSLVTKQNRFSRMVALLILHAQELGYEVSLGDAFRSPDVTYGHPKSLHRRRLAIDLNLFIDGVYITDATGHNELGIYWKSIGGSHGGDWQDHNHYSLSHEGIK